MAEEPKEKHPAPLKNTQQGRGCALSMLTAPQRWARLGLVGGMALALVLLLTVCATVIVTVQAMDFLRDPLGGFLGVFGFEANATPQEVDSRTIVLGIQQMALLQTASGNIEITKTVVDTGAAPDAELMVSYVGHVTAGIDLSQVREEDVAVNPDGSVTVTLPPAYLTGCYLGKAQILSQSCTDIPLVQDCNKIVAELRSVAYDRALEELRATAEELQLTELAYQQAEAQLYELLGNFGFTTITFQRSEATVPPDGSCFAP